MATTVPRRKDGQWLPSGKDVVKIHSDLTALFAAEQDPISPPGVRSMALLESACGRALTSLGGVEKYPALVMKLASLTQAITKNHPFHNGNKRAALATLLTSLHRNKLCLKSTVSDDDVFKFIVAITADEFPKKSHSLPPDEALKQIAWWIKKNTEQSRITFGSIRIEDFIKKCRAAGVQYKFSGGSHLLMNPKASMKGRLRSIRISGSTRQLDGPTAASYVGKLGLNAANSGIDSNEFHDEVSVERKVIHRFIVVLRRLAKT
jgi:prophage maintenance system killer protein